MMANGLSKDGHVLARDVWLVLENQVGCHS
jgi:hypothetical protein